MDRDRLRQIVAEQVRLALGAPAPADTFPPPPAGAGTVVAVFCGGQGGLSAALAQVAEVAKQAHVVAVVTTAAKEIIGEERLRSEAHVQEIVLPHAGVAPRELLDRADVVLVAQLTRTTLARLGLGLAESLATSLVLNALWAGEPVVVARDGVDPDLAAADPLGAPDVPRALVRLYGEYLDRVAAAGAVVIPTARIADTVLAMLTGQEAGRERPLRASRVITQEDVRRAARRGESIDVSQAIVTPLARDVARELGVELNEG